MIRDALILLLPVLMLVDVTVLVAWSTIVLIDKIPIRKFITLRGLLIALIVIAVHVLSIAAVLTEPPEKLEQTLEKFDKATSGPATPTP
jgi:hypothetical protein